MLGISFGEILIIGTIGLLVIGPKRLPETARFLGHLFNRMQRQINSVKADIRREMALEDMKKIQREYESTSRDMRNVFDQAAAGVSPPAEFSLSAADEKPDDSAASSAVDKDVAEKVTDQTDKKSPS